MTGAGPVEDYIAAQPEPLRATLLKVCGLIRKAVPPGTTEGIAYGMPCFKRKSPLIGFSASKDHWGLHPMSGTVVSKLEAELKKYSTSKGTIRFEPDQVPTAALLKKIIRARLDEIEKKA